MIVERSSVADVGQSLPKAKCFDKNVSGEWWVRSYGTIFSDAVTNQEYEIEVRFTIDRMDCAAVPENW